MGFILKKLLLKINIMEIIDKLQKQNDLTVLDCGIAPENYTSVVKQHKPKKLIIIDAVEMGLNPGEIRIVPKEKIADLRTFLEDVVLGGGTPVWAKLFDRLGGYFSKRFGPDWKEKDQFFKEFEEKLREELEKAQS